MQQSSADATLASSAEAACLSPPEPRGGCHMPLAGPLASKLSRKGCTITATGRGGAPFAGAERAPCDLQTDAVLYPPGTQVEHYAVEMCQARPYLRSRVNQCRSGDACDCRRSRNSTLK
jgi:hypothetical protein